jgi:dUTP pyrophosphatase
MINTDPELDYEVKRGDRVAQLIISRYDNVTWTEVTELSGFDRGGGFGHSGR